ncbi:MAG: glycerate kinase [Eubacterium sp.]
MKILIATDSYKGSLDSTQVCYAIKEGILSVDKECDIICLPMADGGEGFAECIEKICNGTRLYTKCHNIYGGQIDGHIITVGDTAIIESATASGLLSKKNVMMASSYGTGELIKYAVSMGYNNIVLGLGGSGCCDGGAGALEALGTGFLDENQREIAKIKSRDLNQIFGISFRNTVKNINFTFACDVTNPMYGKNGAAYVFAPQKGARKTDVEELDDGLKRLNAFLPRDVGAIEGGGAAGGLCAGLYSVYGGTIKSGFDVIAQMANLDQLMSDCDIVVTGEGKTDSQTLMGKLPYRVAKMAKDKGKQCVVISGQIDNVSIGDKMIALVDDDITADYAISHPQELLTKKAKLILQ